MTNSTAAPQSISPDAGRALEFSQGRKKEQLKELIEFLQIPSISTQPDKATDVAVAADWLAREMSLAGLENVSVIPTKGHPLVYGDWLRAGPESPTVLVYGHYDVQPPDPLELWNSPPFEPRIQDDHIYARGASDDKGQLYIHVKSIESYLKSAGKLPINVKFIFEGEEESGGESLEAFVPDNKDLLKADTALVSDTHIVGRDQPSIVYALRGMCYVFLNVTGPTRDLHSGGYGGAIDNPINALGHIIAKLKNEEGRILIPGFYDRVRTLSDEERRLIARGVHDESAWLADTGAPRSWGEPEFTVLERIGARPTLDVNGLIGGYTDSGAKTVLPSKVHAKISMRLVPDQDPQEIFAKFQEYVREITPDSVRAECKYFGGAPPCLIDTQVPEMKAATKAYERVFGKQPIYKREGGSIPVISLFQEHLGIQSVLMGFGLADDHIHSPNERMYLPNFYRGIETSIHYLDILGNSAGSA
ncbi:MAG: dipeptidase [Chloroflexota bacterium]|nr:MAG: dipeptidase [Chloroflexota bacterium]